MTGCIPALIGTAQRVTEVRRIADDTVKPEFCGEMGKIRTLNRNPVLPWGIRRISGCLLRGLWINLNRRYAIGAALSRHDCHQSGAASHIQHGFPPFHRKPRTQQDPIGPHLHGATVLFYPETFEIKVLIGHSGWRFTLQNYFFCFIHPF